MSTVKQCNLVRVISFKPRLRNALVLRACCTRTKPNAPPLSEASLHDVGSSLNAREKCIVASGSMHLSGCTALQSSRLGA